MKDLRGIYPALPTPMLADGAVNYAVREQLVDYEIAQGIDGLYVGGSTAESFLLTEEERMKIAETVLRRADGLWAYQLAVVVDDAAQGVTHVGVYVPQAAGVAPAGSEDVGPAGETS